MEINITNLQNKIRINSTQLKNITKKILKHEKIKNSIISLVFVSSQKIRYLNKRYLKKEYATDVLAFDLKDNYLSFKNSLMGEIIISIDAAKKNAKAYGTSINKETILYIIHGILHLIGYDDHKPKDIKKMRQKEQQILRYLNL